MRDPFLAAIRWSDRPAYWFHHPPVWVNWCLRHLPEWILWRIARAMERVPGLCWATLCNIALYGEWGHEFSGLSARGCLRYGVPCYCGKYQHPSELVKELDRSIRDPADDLVLEFPEVKP